MEDRTASLTIEYSLMPVEEKVSFAKTLSDIQDVDALPIPSQDDGDRYERFIEGCTQNLNGGRGIR